MGVKLLKNLVRHKLLGRTSDCEVAKPSSPHPLTGALRILALRYGVAADGNPLDAEGSAPQRDKLNGELTDSSLVSSPPLCTGGDHFPLNET